MQLMQNLNVGHKHSLSNSQACGEDNLQLLQRICCTPNLVKSHANIAAQHTGALVDEQAASEVVLGHLILLLPEVDLADAIPGTRQPSLWHHILVSRRAVECKIKRDA